ncbi:hypothetical protein C8R43DRAFT_960134 [Mycena crocata]|nr:hypothetical protein C8R43DRAFT_960134 [Mycena crocata]
MPGPPRNGSVSGIRARDNPDLLYRACSFPFFPAKNFRGLAEHDRHKSCQYYFVTSVGTYTNTTGAAIGKKQQDRPEVLTAPTARGISHMIFDWCKKTHNHPLWPGTVTPRQTQDEWDAMTTFDFISYVALPKEIVERGPKRERRDAALPAAPPRAQEVPVVEITRQRRGTRTWPASDDDLRTPKVGFGPAPADQFAATQALVRSRQLSAERARLSSPQDHAEARSSDLAVVKAPRLWFALSDGQVFTNAATCSHAYNEAPNGVRLRIFHSLKEVGKWLGE